MLVNNRLSIKIIDMVTWLQVESELCTVFYVLKIVKFAKDTLFCFTDVLDEVYDLITDFNSCVTQFNL